MELERTDAFRKDAVRIALTSGLTRKRVASDLGVGLSTLNKWITAHRDTDVVSIADLSLVQENDRLRRENRILKEDRDILKKQRSSSRAKSHEVQVHRRTSRIVPNGAPVPDYGCQPPRFTGFPPSANQPQITY
jgi:transposase